MKTIAIIQARMGSTRLPGKVLKDIVGKSMLERVVARVQLAGCLNSVVVATTKQSDDEEIIAAAEALNASVFRGSEQDVLDRFYQAAMQYKAKAIVRVTADCPLIDPGVIDRAVMSFRDHEPDYVSTSLNYRTYPRGIGAEVMSFSALEKAWEQSQKPYERSHVTPYIYQHPDQFELLPVTSRRGDHSHLRWTVDTQSDLDFVRAVYARLEDEHAPWPKIHDLLVEEPDLAKINERVEQKQLEEG